MEASDAPRLQLFHFNVLISRVKKDEPPAITEEIPAVNLPPRDAVSLEMDKPTLPTPRSLLTSLITTLTSSTIQSSTNPTNVPHAPRQTQQKEVNTPCDQYKQPTNPLKFLSPSQRAILSTLHVLLPTGVLLQSLDLLDRELIVKVIEEASSQNVEGNERGDDGNDERMGKKVVLPQAQVQLPRSFSQNPTQAQGQGQPSVTSRQQNVTEAYSAQSQLPGKTTIKKNVIFVVRSSQVPKSRFRDSGAGFTEAGLTYTVRLESWNCSCAAFAFESFPGHGVAREGKGWLDLVEESIEKNEKGGVKEDSGNQVEEEWEFGGLSSDGKGVGEGGKVPVCKHLLACLLAERWKTVLGSYVKERVVGCEEMAGVGGEG